MLVYFNKKHGLRTSGLLFIFWFLLTIFSIPRVRTEIMNYNARSEFDEAPASWDVYQFYSFFIFFSMSFFMLVINCFADQEPTETKYPKVANPCPELGASFPSRMFFQWFDKLILKGFRKPLTNDDLWQMKPEDTSKEVTPLFLRYWEKSVAKYSNKEEDTATATFSKKSASVNLTNGKKKKAASILPALIKAFGPTFLFGSCLKLAQDLLTFASPQVLKLIINFIGSDQPDWRGYFYGSLLFLIASIQTLFLAQYFQRMFLVGLRIRTALISAIYRKALVMSNTARKESTVGEIVNLMAVDAQRFMDLTTYLNMLWSAPLQIGLAIYFLWAILGPSVLVSNIFFVLCFKI